MGTKGTRRIIEPNRQSSMKIAVTGALVEDNLDMSADGTDQYVTTVYTEIAGVTGEVTLDFYDGATALAGTLINSQPMYLSAQPPNGFILNRYLLTGQLTVSIAGASNTTKTAHINVHYAHR
jgi:hypothetical protein